MFDKFQIVERKMKGYVCSSKDYHIKKKKKIGKAFQKTKKKEMPV